MAPTRRAILTHLHTHGEAGAADLGAVLGITAGAVRQQLRPLVAEDWVAHRDIRPGPGRPRRRYRLTRAAEGLFPHAYGDLAVDLLGHIAAEDTGMLEHAFDQRRRARVAAARGRLARHGPSLKARVREVARILDEQGYMASAEVHDGDLMLTEHNCAILAVARRHRCACSSELDFLRDALPDAEIERVRHIAGGETACAYRIRPRTPM